MGEWGKGKGCEICACERELRFFYVLTRYILGGVGEITQLLHTVVHGNDFKVID